MAVLLGLLLVVAIAGLGFVGYHAFQLHTTVTRLETELAAQRARYEQDSKQWHDHGEKIKAQYQGVVNKYNEDAKRWKEFVTSLKTENERLSKWKNVADAEVKASEMVRTARATLEKTKTDADNMIATAQQQATALLAEADQKAQSQLAIANETAGTVSSEAKAKAKTLKDEAQAILNSATGQAAKIIDVANKKAEEIGGSAYEAMRNAALYEQTAKAMKNIIDGYGDQYIIPQQSMLDDLADDFSHTQAGQELKRAREATKVMVRNGTAATCEYVEANRRETAINFVVDAFNGKVDSILSRVKHDNAGRLEQQVRDAYTLVNYNGKAFRDAQITEAFLAARLDELKWAAIAQQLAMEEREEQRRIKEQIREEARAAKEQERALREAAKEEETLRKAMEQAQEQFEHASGEQKAMYEKRLQEMAERLKESEERKERARSMAEQTKKGYVYIISNIGSFGEDVYKIGLTRRWDPLDRVRELGDSSVPFGFDAHATILSDDAPKLEQQLHEHFRLRQVNKVNYRKEFFQVSLKEIRDEIEELGVTTGVHWTMTAEAKEYRESMAIGKAIQDDPAEQEAWLKRQSRLGLTTTDLIEPAAEEEGEEEEN
jgi:hypothetical protein